MKFRNKSLLIRHREIEKYFESTGHERGSRKIIVTTLRNEEEREAMEEEWTAPGSGSRCPVLRMPADEMSFFTEQAKQDRHYHKVGTEIYMSIWGTLSIEVEGTIYPLEAGDTLVVHPFSVHQVLPSEIPFLCRIITLNAGGPADKFIVH